MGTSVGARVQLTRASHGRIATLIDRKRHLLEKFAAEGKATRLLDEELATAKTLEADGLLFLVGSTAVVTPKGRRVLAQEESKPKRGKPPHSLLE